FQLASSLAAKWNAAQQAEQNTVMLEKSIESQSNEIKSHEEANDKLSEVVAQLEALATSDGLTGLKNHRAFQDALNYEFNRAIRYNCSLSLILLDIDRFKHYNDAYGHVAGDAVLQQVGSLLQSSVRRVDFAARYGGEEFAVILPETGAAAARHVAEGLRT